MNSYRKVKQISAKYNVTDTTCGLNECIQFWHKPTCMWRKNNRKKTQTENITD